MDQRDCKHLLERQNPSRLLKKALSLLEHQITKEDVDRQLKIINQYIILSKNGFLVRDLSNIMFLFEVLRKKIPDEPRFQEVLNKLLNLCAISPVLTRTMELLVFQSDVEEYFSWLGYICVWLHDTAHQIVIMNAIYSLLTKTYAQKQYISLERRKNAIYASKLPEILGELIEFVDNETYYKALKVIKQLIAGPETTCENLLRRGVVATIIVRLEPNWIKRFPAIKPEMPNPNEEVLHTDTIFTILTTLLRDANAKKMQAPSRFTLWSLQWAFRLFTMKERSSIDRNNVLTVLLLLMEIYPDLLLGNLTFAYDIAMIAMSNDIVFHPNWTSNFKIRFTTSNEDHNGMVLLLMCISYFPNCLSGPKVIEDCRVVIGLLKLISHQQTIKWRPLQNCFLIRLSLNILLKIVSNSPEEFIEDGGPRIILQLLNRSRENPKIYTFDIIFGSIELLAQFSYMFKSIRSSVAYNDGFDCIIHICEEALNTKFLEEQNQKLFSVCIRLLEQICDTTNAHLVLPVLKKYIDRYLNPKHIEYIQDPKVIIICLSFIWNKICIHIPSSESFVKMGGVYDILDLTYIDCMPIRLVALGILIDLCAIVQCIPYLITWRRDGIGIKALLMKVFAAEDKKIFMKTDENGIILDYMYPLMGQKQYYETYCFCHKHLVEATIGDMFVSCRPKVYCLLQILNEKQAETVEIANEFYKVYEENLFVHDEITYVLANNYLALKLGEAWKEIQQEFTKTKIKPIPYDKKTLEMMVQITDKWAKDIQKIQQDVLRNHQLKECEKEQNLYNTLRSACLADAWESLCEMKYIARCSERLFRIASNFNTRSQINNSLHVKDSMGPLHRTFPSNISISCMHNQHVTIPNEDVCRTVQSGLVSPISSKVGEPFDDYSDEAEGEYPIDGMVKKC
ncbi:hypothetical protein ABEB36_008039 [Hypothenemus hampei]|uniref:Cilia- and flagella-associated protein 69 ARM repeats domain-containing protein n=1 Tax=Hypothenemus hampei TaxID=57062 RepID=A0ABD1EL09_HYPHA